MQILPTTPISSAKQVTVFDDPDYYKLWSEKRKIS